VPVSDAVVIPLGVGDLDELEPLWLQLHAHHQAVAPQLAPYADDATSWGERRAHYVDALERGGFLLGAREADGRLVAYALVGITSERPNAWSDTWQVGDEIAELETLVVLPELRGSGVGTRLLDAVDAELERRGIDDMLIGAVASNGGAIRLYERRGFVPAWVYMTRFGARVRRGNG
jgi:ribosomal protein S18 acetylase RimI-like enzyme